MLVPGAGQPNFDSRVADPFQGKRARREQEVHQLLDKLKPDMIVLDPTTIGRVGPKNTVSCSRTARSSSGLMMTLLSWCYPATCYSKAGWESAS